jgi:hypothetical protein
MNDGAFLAGIVSTRGQLGWPLTRAVIGEDWLKERVRASHAPVGTRRGFTPSVIGSIDKARAHPLALEIREITSGSRDTPLRLDLMESCLEELWPRINLAKLRARLREDAEYEKAEYELLVAAGYSRHGLDTVPNFAETGPDILVIGNDSHVWIECKKKDARTSLQEKVDKFRSRVDNELVLQLEREQLNCHVAFEVLDDPTPVDPQAVVDATLAISRSREIATEFLFDRLRVSVLRLAAPGGSVPGDLIDMLRTKTPGAFRAKAHHNDGEIDRSRWHDPIQVQWSIPEDQTGRSRSIENSLREAVGQIPREGPGIVYIDVNCREWYESERLLKDLIIDVKRLLKGSFRRFNHVVLTSLFATKSRDDFETLGFHAAVATQERPRSPLPHDVPVVVLEPTFHRAWIPGRWAGDQRETILWTPRG